MHIEILQSPWLCELMAFYINLRQCKANSKAFMGLFEDCSLTFDDDKPMLSCGLFDSMKVDIGLTCSICLVSLSSCSMDFASVLFSKQLANLILEKEISCFKL